MRKDRIDLAGAAGLVLVSAILGGNQIFVKLTNTGLSPVFQVALRSLGAAVLLWGWMRWRGIRLNLGRRFLLPGLLIGAIFAVEFISLYVALDLTTVSRTSIIFYSMPVHLSIAANFLLPDERLTGARMLGLALALGGVAIVMADRSGGEASLAGDLLALLGALAWASVALVARVSSLSQTKPEEQLIWQFIVSAPILLSVAPLFGPLLREPGIEHVWLMGAQIVLVAGFAFMLWFYLLNTYPAAKVASFSFLSPVLAVLLAWLVLGEPLHLTVLASLALVAAGIFLINRG